MYRVLIIDDEETIREGLRLTIDWASMDCEIAGEAEDGDEGLKLINSLKPDIIFTDIRMPGLDGLGMISKIHQIKDDCKIIILTGFRNFDYAQEAVRLGAFRFLVKPTKTEEINQAIKDAVKEIKKIKSKESVLQELRKKVKEYYGLSDQDISGIKPEIAADGSNSKYLVAKAIEFIKANYTKNLDLKTVADGLYISTWHLSKLLKKETGNNFIDILNELRIEEAKKLLLNPKYKIYEVAEIVGFSDIPYFTKLFKKISGFTPMEYKNKASSQT